jgi:DNA helicase-2/ATP-dependent DNA helicase PcrA
MKNSKIKIIAGPPGTGKTTYLLGVLEKELKNYSPDKIAFVSFTRVGAYEGRDRAIEKFNYTEDDLPYFRTLHSLAFSSMGAKTGDMIDHKDKVKLGKLLGYNFKYGFTADLNASDSIYLFYIDAYRNNPRLGKQIIENNYLNVNTLTFIERNYREYKEVFNKLDYTDLIEKFIKEGKSIPVKVAIIDEAQDLTSLQWDMIEVAFKDCERIYIAGDDDQAIYEWSGADVQRFINLKGELEVLHHSYRLPSNILNFAKSITNNIGDRIQKDFEPANDGGFINKIDSDLPYEFRYSVRINNKDSYLLLARNRYYLGYYKEAMIKCGIPFKLEGKIFHETRHIEAINLYTRVKKGIKLTSAESHNLERFIKPGYHDTWYDGLNIPKDKKDYYRALIQNKTILGQEPKVDIRTIHSVKGAETDHIFIHLNITSAVKQNLIFNPDSEHRVFYVAVTRAKKSVTIVLPDQRNYYDIDYKYMTNKMINRWRV